VEIRSSKVSGNFRQSKRRPAKTDASRFRIPVTIFLPMRLDLCPMSVVKRCVKRDKNEAAPVSPSFVAKLAL